MSKQILSIEIPKKGIFDQSGSGESEAVQNTRVKVITEELLEWLSEADIYSAMSLSKDTVSLNTSGIGRQETKEQFIKTVSNKLKEMGIE